MPVAAHRHGLLEYQRGEIAARGIDEIHAGAMKGAPLAQLDVDPKIGGMHVVGERRLLLGRHFRA